jgi:hypothetical protein
MVQYFDLPDLPKMEARNIEGLPAIPIRTEQWHEWSPEIAQIRADKAEQTETVWTGQRKAIENELRLIKTDGRYWHSVYGSIYNARPEEDNTSLTTEWDAWDDDPQDGGVIPFIPYPFQLYYWDFQLRAFRTKGPKGDVVVVKSRQMGMSNVACCIFAHSWMTRKTFQGRLLSRKEDLVDETNNPDSLFWKIKLNLSAQPSWILQHFAPGFDWRSDYMLASLTNPATMNHLAGESTNATAGRGGAAFAILLDEFAFMRGGHGIWTATRAASRHRIAVSTVNLAVGSHFYDLVHAEEPNRAAVIAFPHYLHPLQQGDWLEQERTRDTEAGIQTEVLMNFFGDESEFVYPALGTKTVGDYPYLPYMGPVFVAIDDGWTGHWAFHVIQYIESLGRHRIIDSYRNSRKVTDFYGSLFRGVYLDGHQYGEHEHDIIHLFRYLQNPIFVMDTHGKNVEQVAGMSVIERLASEWNIFVNVDYERREYKDRWQATAEIIPFTDWNDNPRVRTGLLNCRTYRWRKNEDGSQRITEDKEPLKNESSHDATAFEYYAGNFKAYKNIYVLGGAIAYE